MAAATDDRSTNNSSHGKAADHRKETRDYQAHSLHGVEEVEVVEGAGVAEGWEGVGVVEDTDNR